jgi:hypothetical protein
MSELQGAPLSAQHGPHLNWQPEDFKDKEIYDKIVDKHKASEPLIEFGPHGWTKTLTG